MFLKPELLQSGFWKDCSSILVPCNQQKPSNRVEGLSNFTCRPFLDLPEHVFQKAPKVDQICSPNPSKMLPKSGTENIPVFITFWCPFDSQNSSTNAPKLI